MVMSGMPGKRPTNDERMDFRELIALLTSTPSFLHIELLCIQPYHSRTLDVFPCFVVPQLSSSRYFVAILFSHDSSMIAYELLLSMAMPNVAKYIAS